MKIKCSYLVVSVAILFFFYSCDKKKNPNIAQTTVEAIFNPSDYKDASTIQSLLTDFHNPANSKFTTLGLWDRIKKWVKTHTGTHLYQNCNGTNYCGPCPGICFQIFNVPVPVDDNYIPTPEDLKIGNDVLIFNSFNEDLMVITFVDNRNFIYEKTFYLTDDWDLGEKVANEFGLKKIIVKKGVYPVVFDFNKQGETIVNIVWEK
jgi:hypothetical protein